MSDKKTSNNSIMDIPKIEEDEPLPKNKKKPSTKYLEEKERWKHGVAFKMMCICLGILSGIYILSLFSMWCYKDNLMSITNNIIEIIKTLLFTLSGYLFARVTEK